MTEIKIGNRIIKRNKLEKPYIIAEAGVNHEGNLDKALEMVELAKEGGADAIKFQSYKAETLASRYSPAYWDRTKEASDSQYLLFKKFDKFGEDEYKKLAEKAERCGIDFMSTPFDLQSADYLENLMPVYKIASADITNHPFLKYIARKNKPILLSTGASTMSEIHSALEVIKTAGNPPVALLHCVLCYPTPVSQANLGMINDMYNRFPDCVIGYSDHTPAQVMLDVLPCAWFLGANIIEKHFTWNKELPGNDHYHGMDKEDIKRLIEKFGFYEEVMGNSEKTYIKEEIPARTHARRSLVAVKEIKKGEILREEHLTFKRPAHGVSPSMQDLIIGAEVLEDIKEDEVIKWNKIRITPPGEKA